MSDARDAIGAEIDKILGMHVTEETYHHERFDHAIVEVSVDVVGRRDLLRDALVTAMARVGPCAAPLAPPVHVVVFDDGRFEFVRRFSVLAEAEAFKDGIEACPSLHSTGESVYLLPDQEASMRLDQHANEVAKAAKAIAVAHLRRPVRPRAAGPRSRGRPAPVVAPHPDQPRGCVGPRCRPSLRRSPPRERHRRVRRGEGSRCTVSGEVCERCHGAGWYPDEVSECGGDYKEAYCSCAAGERLKQADEPPAKGEIFDDMQHALSLAGISVDRDGSITMVRQSTPRRQQGGFFRPLGWKPKRSKIERRSARAKGGR